MNADAGDAKEIDGNVNINGQDQADFEAHTRLVNEVSTPHDGRLLIANE